MTWSKLKKNVENHFTEKLQNRIRIHVTTYSYDSIYARGWVTVDGREVVNFSTTKALQLHFREFNYTTPGISSLFKYYHAKKKVYPDRTNGLLAENGEFSATDLMYSCSVFLNLSIDAAIKHESPIVQFLAVLDRRVGKRRLMLLDKMGLHPLVRFFLNIRMEAENLGS